jgi:hypothetical protein
MSQFFSILSKVHSAHTVTLSVRMTRTWPGRLECFAQTAWTTRDGLPDPGPPWSYLGSMREKPRQVVGDLWHCSALRACRMYDLSLAAASLLSSVYPIKASFSLRFGSKKEKSLLLCLHLQQ